MRSVVDLIKWKAIYNEGEKGYDLPLPFFEVISF